MGKNYNSSRLVNGLSVDASGNVGVNGTPSGSYKFDVTGTGRFTGNVNIDGERLTIGGTSNNAIINNIASVRVNIDCDNNGTGESFTIGHNQVGIDNNNVLFRVQDNANTGINTGSPVTTNLVGALTIVKSYNGDTPTSTTAQAYDTNQSNLYLFGRNAGLTMVGNSGEESIIAFANAFSYYIGGIRYDMGTNSTGGAMKFQTGGANERMRITSGGVVCMNTTTAAGTLSIKAQSDNRAIFFQNPSGGDGSLWLYGASNSFDYKFSTWSQGSAFYLYNNGNYSFAGSNVSDRRLKENIESITYNAIEKIMQLVPKSYNMIAQPEVNRNGFIAQEVKEILPDIITGTETDEEYLGLDYNGLLAVAIKAIQELKAENDDLRSILNRNNLQ